jgi:hypothetical protein
MTDLRGAVAGGDPDVIYAALDLGPDKAQIHVLAPA